MKTAILFLFIILSGCTVTMMPSCYVVKHAESLNNGVIRYTAWDTIRGNGGNSIVFLDTVKLEMNKPVKFKQ